jgi:hypothetical protein
VNCKFGLINNPYLANSQIKLFTSEKDSELQWHYEEVWYSDPNLKLNNNNQISSQQVPLNWVYIRGKNLKYKAPSVYHFLRIKNLGLQKNNLKELVLNEYLHNKYDKIPQFCPILHYFSTPKIFEQRSNDMFLAIETEYYSTLESIIDYRV